MLRRQLIAIPLAAALIVPAAGMSHGVAHSEASKAAASRTVGGSTSRTAMIVGTDMTDRKLTPSEKRRLQALEAAIVKIGKMSDAEIRSLAKQAKKSTTNRGGMYAGAHAAALPIPGPWTIASCIATIGVTFWAGVNRNNVIPAVAGIILGCVGLPNIFGASKHLSMIIWKNKKRIAAMLSAMGLVAPSALIAGAPKP